MKGHFEASGHRPAMQPDVRMKNGENWKQGDDVIVEFAYEALPDVPEADFGTISLERLVVSADDAAVNEALENLAKSAQTFEDRPRKGAAKSGDQVIIDFKGSIDGTPFEGGSAEDFALVLGSGQFIPGFEEQLVGAKPGSDVEVRVTFPADYGAAHLAGKEALFACTVKAVKAPKPAAIDDDLAKNFGAESLDALKAQVTERLVAEYAGAARAVLKRALLDRLDTAVDFPLPQGLVDVEAGQIAHQLWHEENPHVHGHDHGTVEPTEEHQALARRRVKLGLLLAEVGRKADITVSDAEMTQAVMAQARQYRGQERAFFEFVQKNPQAQSQIRAPIFEEKVVDHILGLAQVAEKAVGRDDLKAAVDALDEA
jgi:trigger factor